MHIYILDFCNSKIALCTNIFACFMWYTIVSGNLLLSQYNYYLYHDNELIISIIDLSKLSHSPIMHASTKDPFNYRIVQE